MDISSNSYKKYFKLLKKKTLNNKEKYSDEYINSVKILVRKYKNNQIGGSILGPIYQNSIDPNRKKN